MKIDEDDFTIPMQKFEFVDLGGLFPLANSYPKPESPEFSTDYINCTKIPTVHGPRDIVKFEITDGRYSTKVTVWGDLVVATEAAYQKAVVKPVVGIVCSAKPKIFLNAVQMNTIPSSKIYMNLDTDSITAMRQRLIQEGYVAEENALTSPVAKPVLDIIETLTLKQLGDIAGESYKKKTVFCEIKVTTVEQGRNWWYDSCGCQFEVVLKDGKLFCGECKKNIPVAEKRFRIVILGEDSDEAYNFILMDRAGRRLIGTTATKMLSDMIKDAAAHHWKKFINMFKPQCTNNLL
ncbi:hypothetical protein ACET3Z_021689 [Daucus carota]